MAGASETLRWVFVDDTDDQAFTFTGDDWSTDNSTFAEFFYSGTPYRGAQHATNRNGSVSVAFSGSSVSLFGTANVTNVAGRPDPTWECYVDGKLVRLSTELVGTPQNIAPLCGHLNLADGDHTLTVNVTSRGRPFYVDAFRFYPSPQSPIVTQSSANTSSNATVFIANSDPGIQFSQGNWGSQSGFQFTNKTGASMSLDFVGSKLSWMGWTWSEFPGRLPSNGSWSIDGGLETPFQIPGFPTGLEGTAMANLATHPGLLNNQLFFETPSLPAGAHRLDVRYLGPEEAPLTVGYFIAENADVTDIGQNQVHSSTLFNGFTHFTVQRKISTSANDDDLDQWNF
ncbi:hypothetical protein EST38_g5520 [Candolleomyces aberdarensis]|uniref:Uncharacterized protein n=1 Tax=Candolleomyces aberdarensis TaxID=2316362 RepID=A0A4Q2DMZ7_9AGAR|nr:hypothetical protein EST38_g5520 [Candolleomyces aberdarensis]